MQVLASFTESFKICGHLDRVTLSTDQKVKLAKAFQDKSPITLHLSKGELIDGDDLMLTKTQIIFGKGHYFVLRVKQHIFDKAVF